MSHRRRRGGVLIVTVAVGADRGDERLVAHWMAIDVQDEGDEGVVPDRGDVSSMVPVCPTRDSTAWKRSVTDRSLV